MCTAIIIPFHCEVCKGHLWSTRSTKIDCDMTDCSESTAHVCPSRRAGLPCTALVCTRRDMDITEAPKLHPQVYCTSTRCTGRPVSHANRSAN